MERVPIADQRARVEDLVVSRLAVLERPAVDRAHVIGRDDHELRPDAGVIHGVLEMGPLVDVVVLLELTALVITNRRVRLGVPAIDDVGRAAGPSSGAHRHV
jgi:hypothetical protein